MRWTLDALDPRCAGPAPAGPWVRRTLDAPGASAGDGKCPAKRYAGHRVDQARWTVIGSLLLLLLLLLLTPTALLLLLLLLLTAAALLLLLLLLLLR
ncbi:hypothetical protein [Microbispora bryophytorum]|uniref:hypothetical protein n=1 Tax=Microbispora bryophytorum TaxID=1460882 RepID=UPI0033E30554